MNFTDRTIQIEDCKKFSWMRTSKEEIIFFLLEVKTDSNGELVCPDYPVTHTVDWEISTELGNFLLIPETPRKAYDIFFRPTLIIVDMNKLVKAPVTVHQPLWHKALSAKSSEPITYLSWEDNDL